MKKLLPGLAAGLFIILVMLITKPTSSDFNDFIDERFEQSGPGNGNALQNLFRSGRNVSLAYQIKQSKEYDDKLLFATVSARELDHEVKYLGLMGMWFALN